MDLENTEFKNTYKNMKMKNHPPLDEPKPDEFKDVWKNMQTERLDENKK